MKRTRVVVLLSSLLVAPLCGAGETPMLIDAHIHLYDPTRPEGVPWPPAKSHTLYRPHLVEDFLEVSTPTAITHAIVIEASHWVSDNDWLLAIARENAEIIGIVGNLDPRSPAFDADLGRLARDPLFLGIRPRLPDPPSLRDPKVSEALAMVGRLGLTVEFSVPQYPLKDIAEFARERPESRIVVDHLAGARLRDGKLSVEWKKSLEPFRDTPNTYCKLSAFTSAVGETPAPTDPMRYRELFDAIIDVFGAERVLFGSNWPVSKNAGEYAPLPLILAQYLASRDGASIDAVFRANTLRAYGLGENGDRTTVSQYSR